MILNRENGAYFFQFGVLAKFNMISHAVFTRICINGASPPPFDNMNMALNGGDKNENAAHNRRLAASALNIGRLVFANQVHGTSSIVIKADNAGDIQPASDLRTGDALITNLPNTGLCIQTADCQAVMVFDPVKRVIANIHSGWRGSIQNIIGETVAAMKAEFGSRPEDMAAGISPSLGPCCGEFIRYKTEIPEYYWKYKISGHHFDFWRISRDQLAAEGLHPANIEVSHICTICNAHLFYSYRKEAVTGRFGSVIAVQS